MGGNIVVDGILASCHSSTHHDLAHTGMAPIRWFPEIFKWIFGDENGCQAYVNILSDVNSWFTPNGLEVI